MVDDDPIVCAMASSTKADETPLYSAGLKYVLSDVAKDYPVWKHHMESDLQGYSLWPLSSGGAGDAKRRMRMQIINLAGIYKLVEAGKLRVSSKQKQLEQPLDKSSTTGGIESVN